MIPANYCNPREVGWVQAARWITRNAKLFSKGKLTDKRYQLIRDILGMLLFILKAAPCVQRLEDTILMRSASLILSDHECFFKRRYQVCEEGWRA